MSASDSNKDNNKAVAGEDDNGIQDLPPLGNNQDDNELQNVPVVGPPDNEILNIQGDEFMDKEMVNVQADESMEKEMVNVQADESIEKEMVDVQADESMEKDAGNVQADESMEKEMNIQGDQSMEKETGNIQGDESMEKETGNVEADESMEKEMVNIQGDASNDSEITANLGLARTKMLNLELGSPEGMTESTCSTKGTDETPTLSTQSISPGGASFTSGSGDSKFPSLDSSVRTTPLDSPQMIQAILSRRPSDSPAPSESSATALLTMKVALASGSDTSPSATMESGDGLTENKQKDSSPDVPQSGTPVDTKHPIRTVVKQVPTPASTPSSKPSPAGSVEPSRQSSLEKTDSSMSPSGSRDTETDNADADVSSISPMSLDNKKKVLTKWRPQRGPSLSEIHDGFFVAPSPSPVQVEQDRADTLDDADTLALDSQSVRSSIPERGASVIFPSGQSFPIPPDRNRRAISLPVGPDEKGQKPTILQRRAISEVPDDSRSNPDLPPPSASPDDVSLPVSPDRERRAISLPPTRQENVSRDVRDQRRALSEVPEISRLTDMPPSASPDDVPLPSPLVSSSSSSSQHASDVSLDTSKDKSSCLKNGKSHSSESSLPTAEVDAMMPDLQGWMTRGAFTDDRHLSSGQPGPSGVAEELNPQPVPAEEIRAPLSESSREESTNLSSEVTGSDAGGFQAWFEKGACTDDRHLTSGQPGPSRVTEELNPQPVLAEEIKASLSESSSREESSKDDSSAQRNGKSHSSDSSLPTAEVDTMMPDLQGWMTRGAFTDDRHLTSGQPGPSEELNPQPVPAEEIRARLSESSSREESTNLSSEVTGSDIGGFQAWFEKGAYTDDRHLTSGQPSVVPGKSTGDKMESESLKGKTPSKTTQSTTGSRLTVPTEVMEGSPSSSEMQVDVEQTQEKDQQFEDPSKDPEPQPSTSRNFPRRAKTKTIEVQRTPKRKRDTTKSGKDSSDAKSSSSDPKSNVPVSPEDDMATKKYCSEFNRPFTRQLARSHSTGSVRDAHLKKLGIKGLKEESKSSKKEEKDSDDESSDDEK